jgi:hypothetical protein
MSREDGSSVFATFGNCDEAGNAPAKTIDRVRGKKNCHAFEPTAAEIRQSAQTMNGLDSRLGLPLCFGLL